MMRWVLLVVIIELAAVRRQHFWVTVTVVSARGDPDDISAPHPDLNDVNHNGMIFVGRHCHETNRRLSADHDNRIKYWFGTSFDESHKNATGPDNISQHNEDLPKSRAQVLHERQLQNRTQDGPVPFGYRATHPLDGGVTPVELVAVEPFWLDETPVTVGAFSKFVSATYHETEAEKFGWSFVFRDAVVDDPDQYESDPGAPHWLAVPGATWRNPSGGESATPRIYHPHHPVTHVSHRDAAAYCEWQGKRLPGEREWEAAARHAGDIHTDEPHARTMYIWGDDAADKGLARRRANILGNGTTPVKKYPPNPIGIYDLTGNVWEWQRGGKKDARIVRGGSFIDSLDGSSHHAATLGARATLHGTTTAQNVGFRCAKAVPRRLEHHWTWHDEETDGPLHPDHIFHDDGEEDDEDADDVSTKRKKKVVYKRETFSDEL
jgi:formylglycine-generating enzyme